MTKYVLLIQILVFSLHFCAFAQSDGKCLSTTHKSQYPRPEGEILGTNFLQFLSEKYPDHLKELEADRDRFLSEYKTDHDIVLSSQGEQVSSWGYIPPGLSEFYTQVVGLNLNLKSEQQVDNFKSFLRSLGLSEVERTQALKRLAEWESEVSKFDKSAGSLSDYLPERIQNKTGAWPSTQRGSCSNCYAALLDWFGLLKEEASLPSQEMQKFLDSDTFEQVALGSALQMGDVLVFRRNDKDHEGWTIKEPRAARDLSIHHVAIYLNKDYIWHKESPENFHGWQYQYFVQYMRSISGGKDLIDLEVYRKK